MPCICTNQGKENEAMLLVVVILIVFVTLVAVFGKKK